MFKLTEAERMEPLSIAHGRAWRMKNSILNHRNKFYQQITKTAEYFASNSQDTKPLNHEERKTRQVFFGFCGELSPNLAQVARFGVQIDDVAKNCEKVALPGHFMLSSHSPWHKFYQVW